jgi:hypothetical protein
MKQFRVTKLAQKMIEEVLQSQYIIFLFVSLFEDFFEFTDSQLDLDGREAFLVRFRFYSFLIKFQLLC